MRAIGNGVEISWCFARPDSSLRRTAEKRALEFQDLVDTPSPRFLGRFELLWAHTA
jgi:hypothetical protein